MPGPHRPRCCTSLATRRCGAASTVWRPSCGRAWLNLYEIHFFRVGGLGSMSHDRLNLEFPQTSAQLMDCAPERAAMVVAGIPCAEVLTVS